MAVEMLFGVIGRSIFQRNGVPPRTVANSNKEKIRLRQTTNLESSNSASTETTNAGT
jgi:hypothetical protein